MTIEDEVNPVTKSQDNTDMGFDSDWLDELTDAFDDLEINVAEKAAPESDSIESGVTKTQELVPNMLGKDSESEPSDVEVDIDVAGFESESSSASAPDEQSSEAAAEDSTLAERLNALVLGSEPQEQEAVLSSGLPMGNAVIPESAENNQIPLADAESGVAKDDVSASDDSQPVGLQINDNQPKANDQPLTAHHAIRAQTLDISELQKQMGGVQVAEPNAEPGDLLEDDQLWQFTSLILMRLFDDLELLLIQKHSDEACDLMKQLNRLANIIAFAGLYEQLPLIAYIGNLLPITFSDADIGTESTRRFDAAKMRNFVDNSNEILNCFVYLLTYLSKRAPRFDTGRFTDTLTDLYEKLSLKPGQPSADAPLPVADNVNPLELTTRTVNKLAKTLEALTTESLHYIESAISYGYSNGYADAGRSMNNASQFAREYKLSTLESLFAKLYFELHKLRVPARPSQELFDNYLQVCDLFEQHFSHSIVEKKLKHLRSLVTKFKNEVLGTSQTEGFAVRWKSFIKASAPVLDFEHATVAVLLDKLHILLEKAQENEIHWLAQTFSKLNEYWPVYTESCAEAFISLCDELRAFPTEDIEEADIEQLNHDRLSVLLSRRLDERPSQPYTILKSAAELAETISQQISSPSEISSKSIQNLLIDSRQIHCHALIRCCEILLSLLERIPASNDDEPVVIAQSVVTALYFTVGLMQAICEKLMKYLELEQHTTAITSDQIFYSVLLSLYASPGQPNDGLIGFIVRRMNAILTELQLVWVNVATPTSTEYYCGLIRQLLHIATMCEMKDVRHMIINHLDDIPQADFINTGNATMQHRCMRIMRAMEDNSPQQALSPSTNQMRLFFSKTTAALNQLLSSRDVNDPDMLAAEIARIGSRMSMLGMTTDFPPIIAMIFELHHLAFGGEVDRACLEDLLYQIINVANNVCPDWIQPKEAEFEFIKTTMPVPMPIFQEMYESVHVLHDTLQMHASEEPIAWEHIKTLYKSVRSLVNYAPAALQSVVQNAQNRCRYLKKNIYIELITDDYPPESELPTDSVRTAVLVVFTAIMQQLIEVIVDNAFTSTDYNSRISIVLHPFPLEYSASVFHNGKLFTFEEILERLAKVNIMPASDEHVLDLLVGSRRLALTYPPVNTIAYILPLLRQFDGSLEISNDGQGNTRFYLSFKL